MSVRELIPTLAGLHDSVSQLAERVSGVDRNAELRSVRSDFTLGGVEAILRSLSAEIDGQIRTSERPFTVAVVGEFKVGKSTLINALLGLRGNASLSAKDDPDTACSILVRERGQGEPEARLLFTNGEQEDTTWMRAVGLTSQVWLDEHPDDKGLACRLLEVQYFVANPLLARFQINDLPGTGSRFWREHSELTHRKMKEADAILWVVGEREPSADGKRNLEILRECSQHVIPIVNVFEDPSAEPPLPRDDDAVDQVCRVLMREYADCFGDEVREPLLISSKVIWLETGSSSPNVDILNKAGFADLISLVEHLSDSAESGAGAARLRRVCGSGIAIGNRIGEAIATLDANLSRQLPQFEAMATRASQRRDEIESIHHDARGRIKLLASKTAQDICRRVAAQGALFVEDTLQIANLADVKTALRRNGSQHLEAKLTQRFVNDYLQLGKRPSWLDELGKSFADDVRDVVMPLWRHLLARLPEETNAETRGTAPVLELGTLHNELIKAVISVIGRVLGVTAVAAILAWIPGGQIVDAVGIVGLIILSAISDPLSGARRRAVERVRLQAEAQQYEIQNRLLDAGIDGNEVIEKKVRDVLDLGQEQAARNVADLRELKKTARETAENTCTSVAAFEHVLRGGAK